MDRLASFLLVCSETGWVIRTRIVKKDKIFGIDICSGRAISVNAQRNVHSSTTIKDRIKMKSILSVGGLLGLPLFLGSHVTADSVKTLNFLTSEPISLILLGIGLISLADLGRKKLLNKKN
jgi:hypothetical protein